MPPEPLECNDFDHIDERYKVNLDGELFLQSVVDCDDGKILLFVSAQHIKVLSKSEIWIMDGTFITAPQHFSQIFTIHGSVGEENHRRFVPLVYMLLPKKNERTYESAFSALEEIAEKYQCELEPEHILLDFEIAEINAVKRFFPGTNLHGCFFHLNQSFFRKLTHLKLKSIYSKDFTIQLAYKKVVALAFLPSQEIPNAFQELQKTIPEPLCNFLNYVSEFYVNGRQTKSKKKTVEVLYFRLWSVHGRMTQNIPRTSNHIEGWHNKWGSLLEQGNPPFYSVVKQFQLEERIASTDILRSLQSQPIAKQHKKTLRKTYSLKGSLRHTSQVSG